MSAWGSVSAAEQIPLLIKALGDANNRQGASVALVKLGETAVPALRKSLLAEKPDVRVWAAYTLGKIGSAAKSAGGDLAKALADSDPALRAVAAQSLGKIGTTDAIDALAGLLHDESYQVRRRAALTLGQLGSSAHPATAKLIAVLSDHRLRPFVRDALIMIGPSTAKQLSDSLDDVDIRFDVAIVLRSVDPSKAKQLGLDRPTAADLPSLRGVLFDTTRQPDQRSMAAKFLAELGEEGFAVLIEAFEQPPIARTAASAFSKAGSPAVSSLVEVLSHKQPEIRATAADALGHIGPRASDALPALIRLLTDPDRAVRYHAVRALHEFGSKAKPAVPALTEVVLDPKENESARKWAIKTLLMTRPETHAAVVKALVDASDEKTNYGVRQLAREKLREIDPEAAKAAGIR
jgi:HEAT repeat protein